MPSTPEERSLYGRIGGHRTAALGHVNTAPARAAFNRRFEDEVDPDRTLPPAERAKRAESARKAYFAQLALKSSRARRKRA